MRVNAASAVHPALLRQLGRAESTRTKQAEPQQPAPTPSAGETSAAPFEVRDYPGKALGIQKIVASGRDIPAAPNSRVGAAIAQARAAEADAPPPGETAPADAGALTQSPLRYGDADLAYLNEAFGARAGDDAFRAEYDFNTDGVLDGADLGLLLGLFGQVKPTDTDAGAGAPTATEREGFTLADTDALQAFWGARAGDEAYVARLDLNSDGVLNGADLGLILGAIDGPTHDPGVEPAPPDADDVAPGDTSAATSPALSEAIVLAEETVAIGEGGLIETRVLEATDLLRVLDGLREDSAGALEASLPDLAADLDALRESLVASLLTPARTDALSSLRALLDRLAGA